MKWAALWGSELSTAGGVKAESYCKGESWRQGETELGDRKGHHHAEIWLCEITHSVAFLYYIFLS